MNLLEVISLKESSTMAGNEVDESSNKGNKNKSEGLGEHCVVSSLKGTPFRYT